MDRYTEQPHYAPQRMSALYQYHNAPEVAPAHGLEYDDSVYPCSDKYPVIGETTFGSKDSTYGYHHETHQKPPRIIFGMKVRTFSIVLAIMLCVIIAAAVGGGVGGQSMRQAQSSSGISTVSFNPSGASQGQGASLPTTIYDAPVPTYTPLSDCPASHNTRYVSSFASGGSGTVVPHTGLNFTKYCDLIDPLSSIPAAVHIAEAFVYSFSDCIEVCAGYNFWNTGSNCSIAVYQPSGGRPGNCWIGNAGSDVEASALAAKQGTDVALLVPGQ